MTAARRQTQPWHPHPPPGVGGSVGQANYATAKAGVVGLTKAVAREWGPFGVRCNALVFGYINTRWVGGRVGRRVGGWVGGRAGGRAGGWLGSLPRW